MSSSQYFVHPNINHQIIISKINCRYIQYSYWHTYLSESKLLSNINVDVSYVMGVPPNHHIVGPCGDFLGDPQVIIGVNTKSWSSLG